MVAQIISKLHKSLLVNLSLALRTPFALVTSRTLLQHLFHSTQILARFFNLQTAFIPTAAHHQLAVCIVFEFWPMLQTGDQTHLMLNLTIGMSPHCHPGEWISRSTSLEIIPTVTTLLQLS